MLSLTVSRLTSDDTNPVSGYQLKELADAANASSKDSENVAYALVGRLSKSSPDTKCKTLKAMKYICINGPHSFRLYLQRNAADQIKQCVNFTASPDPLRGEKPILNVREAAKETLDVMYADPQTLPPTSFANSSTRIEGYGTHVPESTSITGFHIRDKLRSAIYGEEMSSPVTGGPPTASTYGGMGSDGFISTPSVYNNPNASDNIADSGFSSNGVYGGAITKSKYESYSSNESLGYKEYTSSHSTPSNSLTSTGVSAPKSSRSQGFRRTAPSSWSATGNTTSNTTTISTPETTETVTQTPVSTTISTKPTVDETIPGDYERKLIANLTTPSGIRVLINQEEKNRFLNACNSINHIAITRVILSIIEQAPPTPTLVKCLCLIEALLESGSDDTDDYLNDHPETILALQNHSANHVTNITGKVLVLLGLKKRDEVNVSSAKASVSTFQPRSTSIATSTVSPFTEPEPQAQPEPEPEPVKTENNFMELFSTDAPAPVAQSSNIDSLFASLSVESTPTQAPTFDASAFSEPMVMNVEPTHNEDLFGLNDESHVPSQTNNDPFAGLFNNDSAVPAPNEEPQADVGNAFSFLDDF